MTENESEMNYTDIWPEQPEEWRLDFLCWGALRNSRLQRSKSLVLGMEVEETC